MHTSSPSIPVPNQNEVIESPRNALKSYNNTLSSSNLNKVNKKVTNEIIEFKISIIKKTKLKLIFLKIRQIQDR